MKINIIALIGIVIIVVGYFSILQGRVEVLESELNGKTTNMKKSILEDTSKAVKKAYAKKLLRQRLAIQNDINNVIVENLRVDYTNSIKNDDMDMAILRLQNGIENENKILEVIEND